MDLPIQSRLHHGEIRTHEINISSIRGETHNYTTRATGYAGQPQSSIAAFIALECCIALNLFRLAYHFSAIMVD